MCFKSGFISIIGRPNVGKSTLMNALIQHKVAIVSPKAQTTRNKIQGILTTEQFQMIFIDTPGIHKPHNKLGESMNKMAFSSRFDSEVVLLLLDCSVPLGSGDQYVIEKVKNIESPLFVVLNKIDLVSKEKREEYRKEVEKIINDIFDEVKPEGMKDMGKVMGLAQGKLKGKADMKEVSTIIRNRLQ